MKDTKEEKLNLKKYAFATAYATKVSFENITKGILQVNGTNQEHIQIYARKNSQADTTSIDNIVLSNELQNLQDLLTRITYLGLDVSKITMEKIDNAEYNHKEELEKAIMDFIINTKFIDVELLDKLVNIKTQMKSV